MFYAVTEDARKSGTIMPNFINQFAEVEWYRAHLAVGMFEVMYGAENYDECARHFQTALWLRDDKTEAAGFLSFLLYAGLVKDSIAHGYAKGNAQMYYEAGLKSEDEIFLYQVGLLFLCGVGQNGIKDDAEIGKDPIKAFNYLYRSYSIFDEKQKKGQPVIEAYFGLTAGFLGYLCFASEKSIKNEDAAFRYLTVGHELGDPCSTYLLAGCYKEGIGVKPNNEKAARLMEELKSMNHPGVEMLKI